MRETSMSFAKEALHNAFRFVINVSFIFSSRMILHTENTLTTVVLSVGFTMLPSSELHMRPGVMCCIVLLLYIGGGITARSALLHPALTFFINFWFLVLLLTLISKPMEMKTNISFLLYFVFSQSTYVPWMQFPARLACVSLGALLICNCIVLNWKREGIGRNGHTLKEQFQRSRVHRSYILHMSLGILLAVLIASILQLSKPLWISIIVMSLTQLESSETLGRIHHRFVDTLTGIMLSFVPFQLLIPQQYAMLIIMLLGYIGFFLPEYKYRQMINAISALSASLIVLDTKIAIENQLFCFVLGAVITIVIYMLVGVVYRMQRIQRQGVHTTTADDHLKNGETVTLFSIGTCTYGE